MGTGRKCSWADSTRRFLTQTHKQAGGEDQAVGGSQPGGAARARGPGSQGGRQHTCLVRGHRRLDRWPRPDDRSLAGAPDPVCLSLQEGCRWWSEGCCPGGRKPGTGTSPPRWDVGGVRVAHTPSVRQPSAQRDLAVRLPAAKGTPRSGHPCAPLHSCKDGGLG